MDETVSFPFQLKQERIIHGLSQDELAKKLGVEARTVARWEKGEAHPRPFAVPLICNLFGKSASELGLLVRLENEVTSQAAAHVSLPVYREEMEEAQSAVGFCGRVAESAQLARWIIEDRSQLVAILGMGGIGKTTLVARTIELVRDDFVGTFWRSLKNAPPLTDILKQALQFLSRQEQPVLPETIAEQITLLIRYLNDQRCLLVLDNLETIMQPEKRAGNYRPGYENYAEFFQRLGEVPHQSCLILTSREKPAELTRLEGDATRVRLLRLEGLPNADGRKLLNERLLQGSDEQWALLVQRYAGNPLALKLVASSIHEFFGNQIGDFFQAEEYIFGDIDELLHQQFERLSPQERELMYWLAIEREALSLETIKKNLVHMSGGNRPRPLEALESLSHRSLIEKLESQRFFLQPVILEYVGHDLVERASEEFLTFSRRARNSSGIIPPLWQQFAFVKATASDYVRETQTRLLLAPLAEKLISYIGRAALTQQLALLLEQQRQVALAGGDSYLAGNVLNFLLYLQSDLRGLDFSGLTVRQAYLQNAHLPETDFTRAAFNETIFTSTFGAILSVAFHPSGKLLAAGTATGDIWLYQVPDGVPVHTYQGHIDGVWGLAFSTDGTLLASSSDDKTVRVWQVEAGEQCLLLEKHTDRVRAVAFSPDGSLLASGGSDALVCLWQVADGQLIKVLEGHEHFVWSVAFHPDGKMLASGSADRSVRLWDLAQPGEVFCVHHFREHTDRIRSIAFHPDGYLLASASDDRQIRLWNIEAKRCVQILQGHTNRVWSVAFSPDGARLVSGSEDCSIRLWDYSSGLCEKILQGHTEGVRTVAIGSTGLLASGGDDQTLRFWDGRNGSGLKTLQGYTNRIRSLAFASHTGQLVSASENQEIRLWNVQTGHWNKSLPTLSQKIRAIATSQTGPLLASVGGDQLVHLWNLTTGQQRLLRGHTNWILAVAFSPAGKLLASGGEDNQLLLWDVQSTQPLRKLTGHTDWIRAVAFSSDGALLVSGGHDRRIRFWDTKTGNCLYTSPELQQSIRALVFHPGKPLLFSASEDGVIHAWDTQTGAHVQSYTGHKDRVIGLDINATGTSLVSCSDDLSLRLWDLTDDTTRVIERAHTSRIRAVMYSPDDLHVISCGDDGFINVWDIATLTCVKTLVSERPYERLNIAGATGLTEVQRVALSILGAIEE